MGSLAICTRTGRRRNSHTIMGMLYDADAGTVLGRDFKSWAKILAFYAVYYSFLGVLFWGFTITFYQGSMVEGPAPLGGKPVVRNSRLDQPGASTLPFNVLGGSKDINAKDSSGDHRVVMSAGDVQVAYCDEFEAFFDGLKASEEACGAGVTPYDVTCKMSTIIKPSFCKENEALCKSSKGKLSGAGFCKNMLADKKPVVALNLNKIVDWQPLNKDYANAVQFKCYEFNAKKQAKVEDSNFEFVQVSVEDALQSKYFPYPGLAEKTSPKSGNINPAYNKPFVAYAVVPKDGNWDGEFHDFRCEVVADNINRPTTDGEREGTESASKDLFKINVGYTEFGIKF